MRKILARVSVMGSLMALSPMAQAQAAAAPAPQPPAAAPAPQPPAAAAPVPRTAAPAEPTQPTQTATGPAAAQPTAPASAEPAPPAGAAAEVPTTPAASEPTAAVAVEQEAGQQEQNGADKKGKDKKKGKKGKDKKKGKKKRKFNDTKLDVDGFLHARYTWQNADNEPSHLFRIRNARLRLDWEQGKILDAQIEAEFADEEASIAAWAPLRDAFVRVNLLDELRLRAGQFKKPVSGLELTGRSRLALAERGLANAWLVDDLRYGDRDIGVQAEGRFGDLPRLNYAVGLFNGTGLNRPEIDLNGSKDIAARVDADLVDGFNVAANIAHKRFDQQVVPEGYPNGATLGGADFTLEIEEARIYGEGMYGNNYLSRDQFNSWSLLLLGSYKIPLTPVWKLDLEPVVKGELLKVEDQIIDGHILGVTAGANLHIGKYFRLMVQGETQRAARNAPLQWQDENRLFVQAALRAR